MLERFGTAAYVLLSLILLANAYSQHGILSPEVFAMCVVGVFLAPTFGLHPNRTEYLHYLETDRVAGAQNRRAVIIALLGLVTLALGIIALLVGRYATPTIHKYLGEFGLFSIIVTPLLIVSQAILFNRGLLRFYGLLR